VPLVSVVLIFLNEERFIEQAVKSVRDQTLTDWELILVDDGSTDRSTLSARDAATEDERIRYIDHAGHENRGMSASRNLGVTHTTAPYIAFLDADDVWAPDKLTEQVQLLESMPDVTLVCGALLYWYSWDPASTEPDRPVLTGGMADRRVDPPEASLTLYPLGRAAGAGLDWLVRRSSLEVVGGFEERFRGLYEDQAFLSKIFLRYPVYISSRSWIRYRQHDASYCAQTPRSEAQYWRLRGAFLDWLQAYVREQDLTNPRVSAALRRARRQVPHRRMIGWMRGAARRLLGRPAPPRRLPPVHPQSTTDEETS
jgi:glycosyltransferase involved in cell wall biosynthesis